MSRKRNIFHSSPSLTLVRMLGEITLSSWFIEISNKELRLCILWTINKEWVRKWCGCKHVASSGLNVLLLSSKCWGNFGSLWEIKCLETIKCLVFTCDFEKGSALRSTGVAHKATEERAEDRTCTCAREKECNNQRLRSKDTKAVTRLTTYNKSRCLCEWGQHVHVEWK